MIHPEQIQLKAGEHEYTGHSVRQIKLELSDIQKFEGTDLLKNFSA